MKSKSVEDEFLLSSDGVCKQSPAIFKKESNFKYLVLGTLFGIVFVKAEIISWYRIQEMFLFDSSYMYKVIGTAVCVGVMSVFIIKKFKLKQCLVNR